MSDNEKTTTAQAGRYLTAKEAEARTTAAREARITAAVNDGAALLTAKLRAGGDPTKREIVNGLLQAFGEVADHQRATSEAFRAVAEAMRRLERRDEDLRAWAARPWWRRWWRRPPVLTGMDATDGGARP